nr:ribonuclease H-like domain-containing protein [Tanacetum cinerariifolium]
MGLDDSYMQIRSSILSREVLPDVRSAYAAISSEKSHKVASGSIIGSSQRNHASAFVFNVPNRCNFQRNNQNVNSRPPRPNNLNNYRQGGGSALVCENCDFNGHTIDRCFKIIGYPVDFGKKKPGQNFKGKNVSNNNFVGTSSFSRFIDKQMATPISLIKDNKNGKNVHANMAGENQHMTYTDKESDNVLDISHLKIKVGHPNGIEAFISKIGNLKLSNGLVLYDVLVIPEYCVILISVHKLTKENKVIVAFDESRCYFLNQDLNLKSVLGSQYEGLYYYNNQEPVLNVLKESLQFNDKNQNTEEVTILEEIFFLRLNQNKEPKYFLEASKYPHWTDALNQEMDALLRNETVYMRTPEWYFPSENGFSQSKSDYSLYTKFDKGVFLALLVYVDDIIITSNNISEVVDTDEGICLNQRKYVLDLLYEYGMIACKLAKTLLMSKLIIFNEASEKDHVLDNITDYQKLMGKLIYLTNTRPNISYVMHCLSQFIHSPLKSHLKIAFKILRYLKSYLGLGIHIIKNSAYRALASVTSEVIWILKILKDYNVENLLPVSLHCDSNSANKIAANSVFHERTKHLEIYLHFVREKILKGVIKTIKVESANQIADILTKGLDTLQHKLFVENFGIFDIYQDQGVKRRIDGGLLCHSRIPKPSHALKIRVALILLGTKKASKGKPGSRSTKGKKKAFDGSHDQRTVYKGRAGTSSRNAAFTKPDKPKSSLKHLAPTIPRTWSTCTTLVVPTKRPP